MIITAYIRLQDCTTNERRAFIPRGQPAHGVAKGEISYYGVKGGSWSHIRDVLKRFDVLNFSGCRNGTAERSVSDIGHGVGKLWKLSSQELAALALPAIVQPQREHTGGVMIIEGWDSPK